MYFKDKHILIIGGTGTIGKSLIQAILPERPKKISIFSRDEYKQQLLKRELRDNDILHYIIGDVRDCNAVNNVMHNVDYVFLLAAMKHVDFSESNPLEAVKTNILGTHHVIQAAINQNVEKVIFTSSDKAISPTNAYGASKLIAERLITQANHNEFVKTIFACVRFGNVMGSRGSVIPLFKHDILYENRITITDPSMTRFMMTLEQATKLTIKAMKKARGGETFVLKMPVIQIGVLADVVLEEVCKREKLDINKISIQEIGKKAGEKVYEELMTEEEARLAWETANMFIIPSRDTDAYPSAKKAHPANYATHLQAPLTKEELRSLLLSAELL